MTIGQLNRLVATTASLFATAPLVSAGEIEFNTVSTANSRKVSRDHGPYFGAFAGGAAFADAGYAKELAGNGFSASGDTDGWLVGIDFGYEFDLGYPLRPGIELELLYLRSGLDSVGANNSLLRSDISAVVLGANGILALDLDTFADDVHPVLANLHPYVGAGAGLAYTNQINRNLERPGRRTRRLGEESDYTFAYQWFVGLEFELTDSLRIYGEYKSLTLNEVSNGSLSDAQFDLWTLGVKLLY